jgi:hypothetical protein
MPLGGGTTTRARLTLLDAWPDANETSHGRLLPLGEVLAACSSVFQPSLSRSWAENSGRLGFWAAVRSFLAPHDLNQSQLGKNGLKGHLKLSVVVRVRSSSWFSDKYWDTILVSELTPRLGTDFQQLAVEMAQKRL